MGASKVPYDLWFCTQERINCLEGTHEFFEAIGFQKALLPVPDQGKTNREEPWLSPKRVVGGAWLRVDIPVCHRGP